MPADDAAMASRCFAINRGPTPYIMHAKLYTCKHGVLLLPLEALVRAFSMSSTSAQARAHHNLLVFWDNT